MIELSRTYDMCAACAAWVCKKKRMGCLVPPALAGAGKCGRCKADGRVKQVYVYWSPPILAGAEYLDRFLAEANR